MPVYLPVPARNPRGPDGQGWNRLRVDADLSSDECALRPTSYATLVESRDTRRARYGGFGPCARDGQCGGCPVLNAKPRTLQAFGDRVLVRVHDRDGDAHLMNRPEDGWASCGYRWSWADLSRLEGWDVGSQHHDEHGEGFWLTRTT